MRRSLAAMVAASAHCHLPLSHAQVIGHGVAHREQHKAVFGHLVHLARFALFIGVFNRPKYGLANLFNPLQTPHNNPKTAYPTNPLLRNPTNPPMPAPFPIWAAARRLANLAPR